MLDRKMILKNIVDKMQIEDNVNLPECFDRFNKSVNATMFSLLCAIVDVIIEAVNEENERIEEAQRRGNSLFDDD